MYKLFMHFYELLFEHEIDKNYDKSRIEDYHDSHNYEGSQIRSDFIAPIHRIDQNHVQ